MWHPSNFTFSALEQQTVCVFSIRILLLYIVFTHSHKYSTFIIHTRYDRPFFGFLGVTYARSLCVDLQCYLIFVRWNITSCQFLVFLCSYTVDGRLSVSRLMIIRFFFYDSLFLGMKVDGDWIFGGKGKAFRLEYLCQKPKLKGRYY